MHACSVQREIDMVAHWQGAARGPVGNSTSYQPNHLSYGQMVLKSLMYICLQAILDSFP